MKGSKPKMMPKGKMTMKSWEKSPMDARADKAGKHGKEGSKKDLAADRASIKAYNAKKKK